MEKIFIDGKKISIKSPIDAIRHKIGYVTEDRKSKGLVLDFSIQENIALTNLRNVLLLELSTVGKNNR